MTQKTDQPLYIRMSLLMMGIVAFFYIIYIGQGIIIPLIFSLIIAILLNLFVKLLQRRLNRVIAISIAVLLASVVTLGLLFLIGSQASMFSESWPQLKIKFSEMLGDSMEWVAINFNISPEQIQD